MFPRLRAALPYVPFPAQIEKMAVVEIPKIRVQHKNTHSAAALRIDLSRNFDRGLVGVWGRAAQSRG